MAPDSLKSHIRDWQEMAAVDPFRAITAQRKEWEIREFLATAKPHIDQLFSVAGSLGLPKTYHRALEFGCGAGRFLPHFEKRFKEVWAADVSPGMIDLARNYNPLCKFHLVTGPDLKFFPDNHFDLIYSFLVLQHLPDRSTIAAYIREFMRILRPGGLAAFQVPDRLSLRWRIQPRRRAYKLLHALGFGPKRLQSWNLLPMKLVAMPRSAVREAISEAGGSIRSEALSGSDGIFYFCTKVEVTERDIHPGPE